MAAQYGAIKSEAQRRLGTLCNASDYPSTLDGLFDRDVSYPTIEPPNYLMAPHSEVYQQEQARFCQRFENAVEPAEQAFATELQRLTARLAERLTDLHDGQPAAFHDSAVETSGSSSSGSGDSTSAATRNWMPSSSRPSRRSRLSSRRR